MVYRKRTKWKGKQKPWTVYLERSIVDFLKRVKKKEMPAVSHGWMTALIRKIIIEWALYKGYAKKEIGVAIKKPGPPKGYKFKRERPPLGRPRLFKL
jgi:hypothetical protein